MMRSRIRIKKPPIKMSFLVEISIYDLLLDLNFIISNKKVSSLIEKKKVFDGFPKS